MWKKWSSFFCLIISVLFCASWAQSKAGSDWECGQRRHSRECNECTHGWGIRDTAWHINLFPPQPDSTRAQQVREENSICSWQQRIWLPSSDFRRLSFSVQHYFHTIYKLCKQYNHTHDQQRPKCLKFNCYCSIAYCSIVVLRDFFKDIICSLESKGIVLES